MQRLVDRLLLATCATSAVACGGVEEDDRPLELEYLTVSILAPTCGATQCHSTFRQAANTVFDTPEAARESLVNSGLIRFDFSQYDPAEPSRANLIQWITEIDPFGAGIGRMPFDAPMPNKDVELLIEWIREPGPGRTGGLAFGAQCNPDANEGMACNNTEIRRCDDDWNFGELVMTCPTGCTPDARCR